MAQLQQQYNYDALRDQYVRAQSVAYGQWIHFGEAEVSGAAEKPKKKPDEFGWLRQRVAEICWRPKL